MAESSRPYSLPSVCLIVLAVAFAFQGSRGLWDPDEGFYIACASSMYMSGDWLVPRLNGDPFLDKPPLTYWGIGAGLKLLGHNEWGARLFHALCLVLTAGTVGLLARRMFGPAEGALAPLVYATMLAPVAAANVVTPDTPLTLFGALAIYCFVRSADATGTRAGWWKVAMSAAFGFGFLAKGPAMLILAAPIFVWLVVRGRAVGYFLTWWALPCAAVFAMIGLPWYIHIMREIPGAADYIWNNQVAGRLVNSDFRRNPEFYKGPLIYGGMALAGTLPWSLTWPAGLWRAWRGVGEGRPRGFRAWRGFVGRHPHGLLLALWIAVPLTILCAASSKLLLYALPTLPALALGTTRLLTLNRGRMAAAAEAPRPPLGRRAAVALVVWVCVLIALKLAAARLDSEKDGRALWRVFKPLLPEGRPEIVIVKERISALSFYAEAEGVSVSIERVTTSDNPYPFFVMPESLKQKVWEASSSRDPHVFLIDDGKDRTDDLRRRLTAAGMIFTEKAIEHDRRLFICEPSPTGTLEGDEGGEGE